MKSKTLLSTILPFAILILLVVSCKKKKEEEPFSEKFKVTMQWKNLFDNIQNTEAGTSVTVPSGSLLIIDCSVGGEEGMGEYVVSSIEVTREGASGAKTCRFLPEANGNTGGYAEPVYENTKYTFTLKATDGSVATQGPFTVNVSSDNKVIATNPRLSVYGASNKVVFSTTYKTLAFTHNYDCATQGIFINPRFIEFALTKDASNNLYLTSPSLFESLNLMPEFSAYSCAYRNCIFQSYTGSINFSNVQSIQDENVLTYNDLQTGLTITGNENKILVQDSAHFMFKTAEGKKGIGMFKDVVPGVSTSLYLVFQR